MTKTSDIVAGWKRDAQAVDAERGEIDMRIDALQSEIETLQGRRKGLPEMGRSELLARIGEEVARRMPGTTFGLAGPFGVDSLMMLTFTPAERDHVASLTIRSTVEGDSHAIVDYDRNLGLYGRGSIGELNGMNYPDIEMPDDVDEIVAMIRKQIDDKRTKAAA